MKTSIITTHLGSVSNKPARTIAESRRPINYKMFFYALALIAVGVFLTGCGKAITLQPTATRAASASPAPPSTTLVPSLVPSASPSVTPTTRPTRTTQPTRTARPPTLTPTPTATLIGGSSGKIAYNACIGEVGATCEIKVMNADGSNPTNLTNNSVYDGSPAWSPDGARIAFKSDRDGNDEIYVMNADGSNPINLTNNSASDSSPAWSPDTSKIAFTSSKRDGVLRSDVYVMNADGSNPIRLTNNGDNFLPAWSPDGSKIAFIHDMVSSRELWVMNADGSNPANLTESLSMWDFQITWSPDSTKIAFVSEERVGNLGREISVINADGSGQTQLTNDKVSHCCPVWSPDGTKIAFVYDLEGTAELWVMNADGSNPILLAIVGGHSFFDWIYPPAWSPDGTKIAFNSHGNIHVMNADGSGLTQLTQTGGSNPSWLPTVPNRLFQHPDCTSGWTRLATGGQAKVSEDNPTPNRVRAGPSTSEPFLARLYPGTVINLIEGPVCADGLVFWKVESDLIPNGVGWTAEGDGREYYLLPYQP